jgi:hypothetical protein
MPSTVFISSYNAHAFSACTETEADISIHFKRPEHQLGIYMFAKLLEKFTLELYLSLVFFLNEEQVLTSGDGADAHASMRKLYVFVFGDTPAARISSKTSNATFSRPPAPADSSIKPKVNWSGGTPAATIVR